MFAKTETNKMKGTSLGEFEELILLVVAVLHGDAYGLGILDEIENRTDRTVTVSTVHSTLNRLEKKGFLSSRMGGATADRGGRSKRLFEITALGKKSLTKSREIRNNIWEAIPQVVWKVN